jgi:hypothetical protein
MARVYRPRHPERTVLYGTLSIHRDIKRIQSAGPHFPKPAHRGRVAFLLAIGVGDDLLIPAVHEADETSVFMKIGPIVDEIFMPREIKLLCRPSVQPIGDDPPESPRARFQQVTELSDRIALGDPASKPDSFSGSFDIRSPPNISPLALKTTVALFSKVRSSISLNIITVAARAVLFFASYCIYH